MANPSTAFPSPRYAPRSVPAANVRADSPEFRQWLRDEFNSVQRSIPWDKAVDIRSADIGRGGDDVPRLNAFLDKCPDSTSIYIPPIGMSIRLGQTWTLSNRAGLRFFTDALPFPNGYQLPSSHVEWIGAAGGTMISIDSCPNIHFMGLGFKADGANVCFDVDGQTGSPYGFGTESFFTWNNFHVESPQNPNLRYIRFANTASNNQEYHEVLYNHFYGGNNGWSNVWQYTACATVSLANPTLVDVSTNPFPTPNQNLLGTAGIRVRIPGAGVAGATLDTTTIDTRTTIATAPSPALSGTSMVVAAGTGAHLPKTPFTAWVGVITGAFEVLTVTAVVGDTLTVTRSGTRSIIVGDTILPASSQSFRIATAASTAVTNGRAIVGEGMGYGVQIGGSFNAKKIVSGWNNYVQLEIGFRQNNGSSQHFSNSYTNNEINLNILSGTEAVYCRGENTEASRQHLVNTSNEPITIVGGRFHPAWCKPGDAYFNASPLSQAAIAFEGCNLDDVVPAGTTLWKLSNGRLTAKGNSYDVNYTMAQVGYVESNLLGFSGYTSENETGISDAPGILHSIQFQTVAANKAGYRMQFSGVTPGSFSAIHGYGHDGNATTSGLLGQGEALSGGGTETLGTISRVGFESAFIGGHTFRAHRSELPIFSTGRPAVIEGYTYLPPALSGVGSCPFVVGYRAPALNQAGIDLGGAWSFYQEGATDQNWWNGLSIFGAITNTPVKGIQFYAQTLTPASVAAQTVAEQTFTVTGLTTADKVIVNPPAIANATGIAGARASALNTLAIRFVNPTAGALTPSSGTYTVIAIRS